MGKRISGVVSLTLGILMIGSTLALASSVSGSAVDTTTPTGAVSLTPGSNGQIQITFSVSGSQSGTCTFKYYRDWTLSGGAFSGTNQQTTSVAPRGGGDPPTTIGPITGTVTVASTQAPRSTAFNLTVDATDISCNNSTGGKLAAGSFVSYAVTVVAPADSTPPVITPSVSGTIGAHGYYTSNVALSWSVTDAQSSISNSSGCGNSSVTSDTNGTTFTCQATSAGGTASQSVTIKRDATAPTMTASLTPGANGAGWNDGPVTVTYTCGDGAGSGIDPVVGCPPVDSLTTDGTHTLHKVTTDIAGNTIAPSFTVKIDQEDPTIFGSASPDPNGYGWRNQAVTVHFDCYDGLSGLASCTADATLAGEGANQSVAGTATDNAGNQVSTTVGNVDIDLTKPTASFVGPLSAGWVDHKVTLTWNCSDDLSGVVESSVSQTLGEGGNQSASGTCTDKAGNDDANTQAGVNVDLTPPVITFASRTDANVHGWNDGPVSVTWTCTDDLSGVVHDSVMDVVTTDGAGQTASATCEDLAGNTTSASLDDINIDSVAPSITGHASPQASSDWNNTDVVVSFSCQDDQGGSGIAKDTVAGDTLTDEGTDLSVTSTGDCIDRAGNAASEATVGAINIDKTKPVITGHVDPAANRAGWNNTNVTVSFTCSDEGGSQIAHNDVTGMTLKIDGSNLSVENEGTCVDTAGNVADSLTVPDLNIDKTKPVITVDVSPEPNDAGWHNTDVTVDFTCSDPGGSGVDFSDVKGTTLSSNGTDLEVTNTGTCVDTAGNTADPVTAPGINIDETKPVITASRSADPNGAGWYKAAVTVSFSCDDEGGSGIAQNDVAGATLSSNGAGQSVTNTGTCADAAGNTADPVTVSGINIDTTKPVIAGAGTPAPNVAGWNNTDVTVSFTCTDQGGSGVALNTIAGATLTGNGADQSVTNTGTCLDTAGNVAAAATVNDINIDETKPVITGHVSPNANLAKWHNGGVEVTFTCADQGGSLIDENSVAGDTLTTDGANQSVTNPGACVDTAGNVADPVTVSGINIDSIAPVITGHVPAANANGWHNGDVAVTFTCADEADGSGLAIDAAVGANLTGEGAAQSVTNTGSCVDLAGNVAAPATTSGINIDRSAPVISTHGATAGTPGSNGWYTTAVTNAFTASGDISGLADPSKASFGVSSGLAEGASVKIGSGSVSDRAGNTNPGIDSAAFKIDLSNPTGVAFAGGPSDGGAYLFASVPAAPTCTATDVVSGLAGCVVTGYSTTVGPHTVTATATDNAGRMTQVARTYTVNPWTLKGFYAPVDMGGVWNSVKGGATVPLKFEVFSGATELTDVAASQGFTVKGVACPGTLAATDDIELTTTGGTTLRYDSVAGQFIQNWQTPKKPGSCYSVTMTSVDGSSNSANFKLK